MEVAEGDVVEARHRLENLPRQLGRSRLTRADPGEAFEADVGGEDVEAGIRVRIGSRDPAGQLLVVVAVGDGGDTELAEAEPARMLVDRVGLRSAPAARTGASIARPRGV